jgi:hypothetical protein
VARRLIEPLERWLLDWASLALGLGLLWRLLAGLLLWGGLRHPWPPAGLIDSQLVALALAGAALISVRCLVPRDYTAAGGLVVGLAAWGLALALLPRYGLFIHWPLGPVGSGWYAAAGGALLAALAAQFVQGLRWRKQLRGHGVAWTREWAQDKPYAARKLALRALRYMGDGETQ